MVLIEEMHWIGATSSSLTHGSGTAHPRNPNETQPPNPRSRALDVELAQCHFVGAESAPIASAARDETEQLQITHAVFKKTEKSGR